MWSNFVHYLALIDSGEVKIPQPVADDAQLQSILSGVFAVAGIMAVIFIIVGGIRYSISQGNPGELDKAKDIIVYSLVGLLFVIIAFTIVQFVTAQLFPQIN